VVIFEIFLFLSYYRTNDMNIKKYIMIHRID